MMEKNALWCMVLFLSVLNVGGAVNIYIATRANYTFRSNIIGTFQSIQWTHNNNLVVEWEPPYFPEPVWYRYGDRGQLNIATGDLTLTMVKKADSGVFKGQFQVNNALQYAEHTVTAVDAVSETKVTCEQNHTDITLLCSVEPPMQAEFTWSGPDGFSHVGNRVYVTRAKGDKAIYYCTAKNEVSQKSAEFNIETCAKGGAVNIYIATRANYTFRSNIIGTFQSIQWTHNNNLVVEWEPPYFPEPVWYRYGDRGQLNIATGDLTLTMVKKADSGVFKGQFQVNNALQYAEHTVTAVDAVSETKVTCEQNHTDITLLCSVEPPMQAEFTWSGPDGFSHVGNRVYVTRAKGDKAIYYCTAKNEVSQKSAEFNIETCAKGGAANIPIATKANYTFRSNIIATFQSIQWAHNKDLVVEWDPPNFPEPHWYRYGDRGQLNIKTGDLTLRVVKEDSGLFKGQFQVNGVLQYAEYTVTAIDPFSECAVTCVKRNVTYTLACTVEPPAQATFKWSGPNGFSHTGDSFEINSTENDLIYYCTAKNELNEATREFNLKDCPQDPVPEPPPNPGPIIGGIIGVLIAVALGVIGWLKKDSIRAFFSSADSRGSK
ncbi:uncharacterized protein Hap1MRO34_006917 isoform 2-T2 [Clarias gariepinus]